MTEVSEKHDVAELKELLEKYVKATDSDFGKEVFENFEEYLPKFKKIIPNDYKKMLMEIGKSEEKGMSHEQAVLEAFYAVRGEKE